MRHGNDLDAGSRLEGGSRGAPGRRRRGNGGKRLSTAQKVAGALSISLVSILVVAVLGLYIEYRSDWDSIQRIDIESLVGKQPPKLNSAENILLIGSDTRVNQDGIGGNTGCNCSDTLMILHIPAGTSGDRGAVVMSIPRDTMVPYYQCPATDGFPGQQADPDSFERINATLATGGPACTWITVEQQTGIHLDHFIQLDFTGFENIINDLGGVYICLPYAVDDPGSQLDLSAGLHHVFGHEALAFWREREDVGTGSDLERIQRDQYLMAALVQGMVHSGLLHKPTEILSVLRDATRSMTTDTGLDQNAMLQIAESMRGLSTKNVQFVIAPNMPYPADPTAELSFEQPQADQLFSAIQHDNTAPAAKSKKPQPAAPTPPPVLDATPSQVNVQVENGSGVSGIAGEVGSDLTSQGFNVVGTGDAGNFNYTSSIIEYSGSSDLPEVNTLKAQVPNVETIEEPSLTPGTLDLIIGSSFTQLNPAPASGSTPSPSSSPSPSISTVTASDGAISANVGICQNQAAFAGPNAP
jgi:LCP family protein required for cell wall assembly